MVRRANYKPGREPLYIRVHPATRAALIKLAEERNRSMSGIAAEILEEALMVAS